MLLNLTLRRLNNAPVGSAKLLADSLKEEAEAKVRRVLISEQPPNWDGEERIEDTILRMLVDKQRPLRTGTIQTAEQKIHKAVESGKLQPHVQVQAHLPPGASSWTDVPLLPGSANHRPWHTEFKAPDVSSPSVRHARMDPAPRKDPGLEDDRVHLERAQKELHKKLGRLSRAKESTLDYRLGLGVNASQGRRPNPVSMRGWTNLIEDKIEKARRAGLFETVKGRGKPLPSRAVEESNPFLSRQEFLINRIVKRNGAAPPWIQLQQELDEAVRTFRHLLLDSWSRYAIRSLPASPSESEIHSFRDHSWSVTHASYHTAALAELNDQVRRYNALAPYAVRRPLHALETELRRVYKLGPDEIIRVLASRKRLRKGGSDMVGGEAHFGVDWSWLWSRWRWLVWLRAAFV
uniref:DnaJ homologue subfamily C member 28 conserved domain-containing protein n=1 Tax=Mycena chlorophos TaxID=658473 RepID=A0ABQ0M904_MYCCL|nr:predicted protein [Mycena chlorophos]